MSEKNTAKFKHWFVFFALLIFSSCDSNTETTELPDTGCEDKIAELEKVIKMNEVEIQMLYSSFDTIEQNLVSISKSQGDLSSIKTSGNARSQRQRIAENFKNIAASIEANQKIVASLRAQLATSKNSEKLEKMIAVLEKTIQDKNREIVELRKEMASLSGMIAEKDLVIAQQSSEIAAKDEKIQNIQAEANELKVAAVKAYYLVASREKLLDEKIARKGASAGAFKKKELDLLPNFPTDKFKEISDLSKTFNIYLGKKEEKYFVVSKHPSDSYEIKDFDPDPTFHDPNKYLIVTNPEKFWSQTKYLVVEIRD